MGAKARATAGQWLLALPAPVGKWRPLGVFTGARDATILPWRWAAEPAWCGLCGWGWLVLVPRLYSVWRHRYILVNAAVHPCAKCPRRHHRVWLAGLPSGAACAFDKQAPPLPRPRTLTSRCLLCAFPGCCLPGTLKRRCTSRRQSAHDGTTLTSQQPRAWPTKRTAALRKISRSSMSAICGRKRYLIVQCHRCLVTGACTVILRRICWRFCVLTPCLVHTVVHPFMCAGSKRVPREVERVLAGPAVLVVV